jgi:hypothetical protein
MSDPKPHGSSLDDEAVDGVVLVRLRDDVGDDTLRRYAAAYLGLLADRLERIERAMDTGERAEAIGVMFDLRTSSTMLGASRLAALIGLLERSLTADLADGWKVWMANLRVEADAVMLALRDTAGCRPR